MKDHKFIIVALGALIIGFSAGIYYPTRDWEVDPEIAFNLAYERLQKACEARGEKLSIVTTLAEVDGREVQRFTGTRCAK